MPLIDLLSLSRLSVIAHRGGSKLRPENTLAAFDHGFSLGADAVECDVHLSKDDEVVVIHDPTLERTTDATGAVAAHTARELASVDAGFHFGPGAGHPFRGLAIGVPRLQDVLERHSARPVVIEIKGDLPHTAVRTVEVIRGARAEHRVIVGGFNHAVLQTVRRLAPEIVTSASLEEARPAVTSSGVWTPEGDVPFRLFQVPFRLDGQQRFDRGFVRAARAARLPVQAWIVDDAADMRQLIDWGVTGLISDRPDVAIEVIKALSSSRPGG